MKVKSIIETMKIIEEHELDEINKDLKDPLSLIAENLSSNETYKNVFRLKVTSVDESFKSKEPESQGYLKDRSARSLYKGGSSNSQDIISTGKITEIKKTVTFIDFVVNRQIYIFFNSLISAVICILIRYLM